MVMLNNGCDVPEDMVTQIMIQLRELESEQDYVALFQLWQKSNNSAHQIFLYPQYRLKKKGLVTADGLLLEAVQNVVLSAVYVSQEVLVIKNPIMSFEQAISFLSRGMNEIDLHFGEEEPVGMAVEEDTTAFANRGTPHHRRAF